MKALRIIAALILWLVIAILTAHVHVGPVASP